MVSSGPGTKYLASVLWKFEATLEAVIYVGIPATDLVI